MIITNIKNRYDLKEDTYRIKCEKCKKCYYDKSCFIRHFKIDHLSWRKCKKCGAIVPDLGKHSFEECEKGSKKQNREGKSIIYKTFLNKKKNGDKNIILDKYLNGNKKRQVK